MFFLFKCYGYGVHKIKIKLMRYSCRGLLYTERYQDMHLLHYDAVILQIHKNYIKEIIM